MKILIHIDIKLDYYMKDVKWLIGQKENDDTDGLTIFGGSFSKCDSLRNLLKKVIPKKHITKTTTFITLVLYHTSKAILFVRE